MPTNGRTKTNSRKRAGEATIEALLAKASQGQGLSETERLIVVDALEVQGLSTQAIAKLLNVSDRTIRRDRQKLRELARLEFLALDLAGELWRQYRLTLERVDEALARGDHKAVKSLGVRWGIVDSFAKLTTGLQLKEISQVLEEARPRIEELLKRTEEARAK